MHGKKGFTLIEMVVGFVIAGIVALILTWYWGSSEKSRGNDGNNDGESPAIIDVAANSETATAIEAEGGMEISDGEREINTPLLSDIFEIEQPRHFLGTNEVKEVLVELKKTFGSIKEGRLEYGRMSKNQISLTLVKQFSPLRTSSGDALALSAPSTFAECEEIRREVERVMNCCLGKDLLVDSSKSFAWSVNGGDRKYVVAMSLEWNGQMTLKITSLQAFQDEQDCRENGTCRIYKNPPKTTVNTETGVWTVCEEYEIQRGTQYGTRSSGFVPSEFCGIDLLNHFHGTNEVQEVLVELGKPLGGIKEGRLEYGQLSKSLKTLTLAKQFSPLRTSDRESLDLSSTTTLSKCEEIRHEVEKMLNCRLGKDLLVDSSGSFAWSVNGGNNCYVVAMSLAWNGLMTLKINNLQGFKDEHDRRKNWSGYIF